MIDMEVEITSHTPVPVPSPALARFAALQPVLCCPVTRAPLRLVGVEELRTGLADAERARLPEGTVGAFVSDAARRAYPLRERVASFLEQDALRVRTGAAGVAANVVVVDADDHLKRGVQEWYDRFGWQKNERGQYHDSALFSQDRPEGHGLYELLSHLAVLERLPGGAFVLDAASGALAHPEYLAFSWFYRSRVCVDLSATALQEADAKLRRGDFCLLADLCRLPFRDGTFEGIVSGYTIHHIPAAQQARAVQELYRVLRPGSHLCLLASVPLSWRHRGLVFLLRSLRKLGQWLNPLRRAPAAAAPDDGGAPAPPHTLYSCARGLGWWKQVARALAGDVAVEALRLLNKAEFEWLFGRSNRAAKLLRLVESAFPRLTAALSAYCLVAVRKPVREGA